MSNCKEIFGLAKTLKTDENTAYVSGVIKGDDKKVNARIISNVNEILPAMPGAWMKADDRKQSQVITGNHRQSQAIAGTLRLYGERKDRKKWWQTVQPQHDMTYPAFVTVSTIG